MLCSSSFRFGETDPGPFYFTYSVRLAHAGSVSCRTEPAVLQGDVARQTPTRCFTFCAPISAWGKSTAGKNGAVLRGYAPGRVPAQCYRLSAPAGACGKGSLPEWAVQRFDEMLQDELQPNVITCTALLSTCGKGSKPVCAVQRFDEMRQDEL